MTRNIMRGKSGRPISLGELTGVLEEDLERRRLYIAAGGIRWYMLHEDARNPMEVGIYGRSIYGRCRYGLRYGIYGSDNYGMCKYN